jgi:hypothetical protein
VRDRSGRGMLVGSLTPAIGVLACGALLAATPQTSAQVSETIFTIETINDSGYGCCSYTFDQGQWDPNSGTFTWSLPEQLDIHDEVSGEWIAALLNASLLVRASESFEIELNIGVVAGTSATTFIIGSPLVSFAAIPEGPAQGRATTSFTITHLAGDYALLQGLGPPGTGAFRSYYNGYLSEGTRFTHLVGAVYVDGGGTATASQFDPASGFRHVGEEVYDVSTEIAFTLTAGDVAFAVTTSGAEADECVGDVNGDGVVGYADLASLIGAYGTTIGEPGYDPAADFDDSGSIDIIDLSELLGAYGTSCW